MKNKIFITSVIISFLVLTMLNINMISARNEFEQIQEYQSFNSSNNVIFSQLTMSYTDKDITQNSLIYILDVVTRSLIPDYILNGRPDEIAVYYSSSINSWNSRFPNNTISVCELTVRQLNVNQNLSDLPVNYGQILDINFTNDTDKNSFFVVSLMKYDYFFATFSCLYNNLNNANLSGMNMPVSMYAVSSTFESKTCQSSEYSKTVSDTLRKSKFDDYNIVIKSDINGFINIAFEVFLYSFWLFIIVIFFSMIGLIFWAGYWFYFYIRSLGK